MSDVVDPAGLAGKWQFVLNNSIMLDRVAGRTATELGLSHDDAEIIAYGLQVIVRSVEGVLAILTIGWLLGSVPIALMSAVSSLIKPFSGGAHASRPFNCLLMLTAYLAIATALAKVVAPFVLSYTLVGALVSTGLAAVALWRFAPVEPPQKPLKDPARRQSMRALSFLSLSFVSLGIFWLSLDKGTVDLKSRLAFAGCVSLVWHSFLLTPSGNRFTAWLDGRLNLLFGILRKGGVLFG